MIFGPLLRSLAMLWILSLALSPRVALAVEKPTRDMIVAFCEDTDGPELNEGEVLEIAEYIGMPGTSAQLKLSYSVYLLGKLKALGPMGSAESSYQFSCRRTFRDFVKKVYVPEDEQERSLEEWEKQMLDGVSPLPKSSKPVVTVRPQYPRKARNKGLQGWVDLSFSVTESGLVSEPKVVANCAHEARPEGCSNSPNKIFDKSAIKAIQKYKYIPHTEDNRPVVKKDVRERIVFDMKN